MSLTFCCVGANFQNFKFCIFHLDFLDFSLSIFVFSALLFSIVHLSSMYPFSFCVFHFSTLTLCVFRYFLYFPVQLLVFPTLNFCIIHFHYFCFLVWVSVFSTFTFCIFRFEILYFVRKYCLGASPSHLLQWSSWKPLLPSELCGWVPICRPRGFPQDNLENIILLLIHSVLYYSMADTFLEGEKRGWWQRDMFDKIAGALQKPGVVFALGIGHWLKRVKLSSITDDTLMTGTICRRNKWQYDMCDSPTGASLSLTLTWGYAAGLEHRAQTHLDHNSRSGQFRIHREQYYCL